MMLIFLLVGIAVWTSVTATPTGRKRWIMDGCKKNNGVGLFGLFQKKIDGQWIDEVGFARVQCCGFKSGYFCRRQNSAKQCLDRSTKKTYKEAVQICAVQGGRICTQAELEQKNASGCCAAGCDLDMNRVWTSDLWNYFPTNTPTPGPTAAPTSAPTGEPTSSPSEKPTPSPTSGPTPSPTSDPTPSPTSDPSPSPTSDPSPKPTSEYVLFCSDLKKRRGCRKMEACSWDKTTGTCVTKNKENQVSAAKILAAAILSVVLLLALMLVIIRKRLFGQRYKNLEHTYNTTETKPGQAVVNAAYSA